MVVMARVVILSIMATVKLMIERRAGLGMLTDVVARVKEIVLIVVVLVKMSGGKREGC